jgi:hypothetical protein
MVVTPLSSAQEVRATSAFASNASDWADASRPWASSSGSRASYVASGSSDASPPRNTTALPE